MGSKVALLLCYGNFEPGNYYKLRREAIFEEIRAMAFQN
jgi:hypothetical protein